ncbi:beta strand repeat-containing protein [Acinetobacter larvae]
MTFTFSFNKDVADFELSDIVVAGGTAASTLTQVDAHTYTLLVTPTANSLGTITVNVAANVATDSAGNKNSAASASQDYDTLIPLETVTINTYTDDVGAITGDFASNTKTDDTAPVLNGTISAALGVGHQVAVYASDNSLLGYATVDAVNLTWSYALTGLTEGSSSYYAKVVSAVGNEGAKSNDFTIIVDLTPPVVASLSTTFSLDVDTSNGVPLSGLTTTITAQNSDLITRDNTPTAVKGTLSTALATGEMLQISKDNGVTWQDVSSLAGSDWVYNLSDTYTADTTLNFKFRVRDEAGNTTALSTEDRVVMIDVTTPDAPTLAPIVPTQTNNVASNTFNHTVYGVLEAGTTVALVNDVNKNGMWQEGIDTVIASTVVANDGTWSFNTELPSGALNLAFMVWDKAGNISRLSPITHTGVGSSSGGTETIVTDWGGTATASGTNLGMNSAAVSISQNGNWNFFQSVTATNGNNAYAGRVYEVKGTTGFSSQYLAEPSDLTSHTYGGVITSTVFADFNRDGYSDVVSQVSSYSNSGRVPYWTGNSDGSYTGQTFDQDTLNHIGGVVAYDRTGDGYLDLVIGDSAADSLVFMQNNAGSFVPEAGNGSSGAYHRPPSSAFTVVNGLGTGTVAGAVIPNLMNIFKTVSGVDLDNNGAVDILANVSYNDASRDGNNSRGLGVLYNSGGSAGFTYINKANVFMTGGGADDEGRLLMSMTYADFNGDGWLDLYINRGTKAGADSNESRIYLNDGKGQLKATDAEALWFGDNRAGGSSFAVDWNLDGKVDVIEVPVATLGTAFAPTLYTNQGTGVWGGAGTVSALSSTVYNNITGATAVDYDWDGSVDLVLYRSGVNSNVGLGDAAAPTIVIRNTNVAADGSSLHVRIVDAMGFNSYYGNTVKLYNSAGVLVSTQVINAQSSGSNDSTGIVNFYGLNPNETYSVQLLRNINGVVDNVAGVANLGGYANSTINQSWTGIKAGKANEAIILTAESDSAVNNSVTNPTGIVGTGYNDHFYASLGNDHYNGGGGWQVDAAGNPTWVANGGMDVLDYSKLNASISVDMAAGTVTKVIGGVSSTDTFVNIEKFIAGNGNAVFNSSAGNDHFSGGAGNDIYNLGGAGGGQDTIYLALHNAADATGGNGSDIVNGFHVGQVATDLNADIIDINELLSDYKGTAGLYTDSDGVKLDYASSALHDYLKVTNDGSNTSIAIDRDGGGDQFTTVLTLNGVQTDLIELLYNNQLII